MSHQAYNETKALNYSGAKHILVSPCHYQAWLKEERVETPALKLGRLVHLASLEPLVFDKTVRLAPTWDGRTTEGKAIKKAFLATLKEGEEYLDQEEMDEVMSIAEAAQAGIESIASAYPDAARLREQVVTGKHEGAFIKGRPDLILHHADGGAIIDIKTTMDASADSFSKDVAKYKYHLQAAFYLHMTGAKRFYFVAVEKKAPFDWAVYELDAEALESGKRMMTSACLTYRECNLYNNWPGYSKSVQTITLPKWAFYNEES
jgi:exodeoxyribonuclease VIII